MSLLESDITIPIGASLSFPFEPELLCKLKEDSKYEKLPVIDFMAVDVQQRGAQYGPRTYPQVWLLDYVLSRQGSEVTAKQVAETGYPQTGYNKDPLAPIVKNLQKMVDAGVFIEPVGGRTLRSYKLPIFKYATITYLGNRQRDLGWRRNDSAVRDYIDAPPLPPAKDYELPTYLTEKPPSWRSLAACANLPPTMFVTDDPYDIENAINICQKCPVKPECKQAQNNTGSFGVWGGEYHPLPDL